MRRLQHALPNLDGRPAPVPSSPSVLDSRLASTLVQAPQYDLERLSELRDRHQHLLQDYRRASAAVQDASKALARLRTEAATHPAAVEVLRKPSEQLRSLSAEQLQELLISPRVIQQIITAESRRARLTSDREKLRDEVTRSTKFSARLEEFAKARNL